MTKLKEMVHLDYVTVKPYFTIKNLVIFAAVALFLTAMSDNILSGMGVGLMIATLFVSYPFALADKNNLDALYTTLSVSRNTVVKGRYLFTLLLNICAVLFSFIIEAAGLLIAAVVGVGGFSPDMVGAGYFTSTITLSVIFILVQLIQLPVFFKLGYAKAKVLSIVPFAIIMAGYMAFLAMQSISSGLESFLEKMFVGGVVVPSLLAVLVFAGIISFCLSLSFYKKREF